MRIRWTRAAAEDLEHIKNYLTEHHPRLAQSTVIELYETIRSLKTSPRRGRLGREEERANWCYRACHISRRTASRRRPSKFCTSTTARRTVRKTAGKKADSSLRSE